MSESKYFFTGDLIKSNIEKIPRFEKGVIFNDAIFQNFSQIDEIVKDIQEKKDNAMAMEFTKCIGELLRNNGVVPKITEYSGISQTDKTFETRYGVSIDELDFSEHDKVFEDKIAELKKDYNTASELLGKYQRENEALKKRIQELRTRCTEGARDNFDKEIYGCLSIVSYPKEIENENKQLKQRIAELESKETEKPTKCHIVIVAKEINGQTYVALDDFMSVVNNLLKNAK